MLQSDSENSITELLNAVTRHLRCQQAPHHSHQSQGTVKTHHRKPATSFTEAWLDTATHRSMCVLQGQPDHHGLCGPDKRYTIDLLGKSDRVLHTARNDQTEAQRQQEEIELHEDEVLELFTILGATRYRMDQKGTTRVLQTTKRAIEDDVLSEAQQENGTVVYAMTL
eukprot:1077625-Amphidinium_carterae.2